jgi:hypothetical protein
MDSGGDFQILGRALAVLTADQLILDPVSLVQIVEPGPLDGRDVHENVGRAALRLDKSISFGSIEPLHSSGIQGLDLKSECTPSDMPQREAVSTYSGEQRGDAG